MATTNGASGKGPEGPKKPAAPATTAGAVKPAVPVKTTPAAKPAAPVKATPAPVATTKIATPAAKPAEESSGLVGAVTGYLGSWLSGGAAEAEEAKRRNAALQASSVPKQLVTPVTPAKLQTQATAAKPAALATKSTPTTAARPAQTAPAKTFTPAATGLMAGAAAPQSASGKPSVPTNASASTVDQNGRASLIKSVLEKRIPGLGELLPVPSGVERVDPKNDLAAIVTVFSKEKFKNDEEAVQMATAYVESLTQEADDIPSTKKTIIGMTATKAGMQKQAYAQMITAARVNPSVSTSSSAAAASSAASAAPVVGQLNTSVQPAASGEVANAKEIGAAFSKAIATKCFKKEGVTLEQYTREAKETYKRVSAADKAADTEERLAADAQINKDNQKKLDTQIDILICKELSIDLSNYKRKDLVTLKQIKEYKDKTANKNKLIGGQVIDIGTDGLSDEGIRTKTPKIEEACRKTDPNSLMTDQKDDGTLTKTAKFMLRNGTGGTDGKSKFKPKTPEREISHEDEETIATYNKLMEIVTSSLYKQFKGSKAIAGLLESDLGARKVGLNLNYLMTQNIPDLTREVMEITREEDMHMMAQILSLKAGNTEYTALISRFLSSLQSSQDKGFGAQEAMQIFAAGAISNLTQASAQRPR